MSGTGSTRPHRGRPSSHALDAAFNAHKDLSHVRVVHALYMDAAKELIRVAHRLEALNESRAASAVEALVVLIEQQATRHISGIAARHKGSE